MPDQTALITLRSRHSCIHADLAAPENYLKKDVVYKIANIKINQRAQQRYSGMDLYVFRYEYKEDGSWELRNSKPCAHCVSIIKAVGIRYVYYSESECNSDGTHMPKIIKIRAKDLFNDHLSFGRRMVSKSKKP
jgi:hypothetical protein